MALNKRPNSRLQNGSALTNKWRHGGLPIRTHKHGNPFSHRKKKQEEWIMLVQWDESWDLSWSQCCSVWRLKAVENLFSHTSAPGTRESFKIINVKQILSQTADNKFTYCATAADTSVIWGMAYFTAADDSVNLPNLLFIKIQLALAHVWNDEYDNAFLININIDRQHCLSLLIRTEFRDQIPEGAATCT